MNVRFPEDELRVEPIYFGNDTQQTNIIEILERDAKKHQPQLHMISGGPASGKSETLTTLQEGLKSDFEAIAHAEDIENGYVDARIPKEIASIVKDMSNEKNNMYVQHEVYKSKKPGKNGKDFYVIVADGELPLTDKNNVPYIKRIAEMIEQKDKGYDAMWVSDVPILKQRIPIFKPAGDGKKERVEHNKMCDAIKKAYPKIAKMHELRYDIPEIKRALWEGLSTQGESFVMELNTTLHKPHTPEDTETWKKVCDAAIQGNKSRFTSAMRVLAANAKQDHDISH